MNPHARLPATAQSLIFSLWTHRRLIVQMTRREVVGRYRGSVLGLAWSFLNPLLMLVVYTFVFGVVFKAKWGAGNNDSRTMFALVLFAGIIIHGLLAECMIRAPDLIVAQTNYVKKVVFPLEILAVVVALSAVFHALVSSVVLICALAVVGDSFAWTALLFPLILAPLAIGSLGLCWIIASLAVFVRDIAQTMAIFTTILMFVSPVFFPVSALPPALRSWVKLNPLTFFIEEGRKVVIWGAYPDWATLGIQGIAALFIAWLGYWWFQRTRKGFGDVL